MKNSNRHCAAMQGHRPRGTHIPTLSVQYIRRRKHRNRGTHVRLVLHRTRHWCSCTSKALAGAARRSSKIVISLAETDAAATGWPRTEGGIKPPAPGCRSPAEQEPTFPPFVTGIHCAAPSPTAPATAHQCQQRHNHPHTWSCRPYEAQQPQLALLHASEQRQVV